MRRGRIRRTRRRVHSRHRRRRGRRGRGGSRVGRGDPDEAAVGLAPDLPLARHGSCAAARRRSGGGAATESGERRRKGNNSKKTKWGGGGGREMSERRGSYWICASFCGRDLFFFFGVFGRPVGPVK